MTVNIKINKAKYFLAGLILTGFAALFLPSCVHEPLIIPDPVPIDTTGTPIDTNNIPPDSTFGTPCDPNVVYFSQDILPLLVSNCAKSGCHNTQSHKEGVITDSYQGLMSSGIVKAGNVNNSKLIKVIKSNNGDDIMPPSPAQRMNADQIALLSKWIEQGAKDLTCDEAAGQCITTNVSYSGFVAPVLTAYCTGCHSGGSPSGGITLTTYENVRTMAQSGKLYGAINWSNGFIAMPQGSNKLSQCRIDKIKGWIDEGALNN